MVVNVVLVLPFVVDGVMKDDNLWFMGVNKLEEKQDGDDECLVVVVDDVVGGENIGEDASLFFAVAIDFAEAVALVAFVADVDINIVALVAVSLSIGLPMSSLLALLLFSTLTSVADRK